MLSIVIVNYNVKYFLEQCLCSVQKAIAGIQAEVIVIDNNSADESVGYLQPKFSWVKFIANKENTGYAKACNQGLKMAKGEYILFLNPDTILGEDCLEKSIAVLQQHDSLGALGIRMIDGKGRFLPESKRGFPSLRASFFKLSGLIKIFPYSRVIAHYYLGHLPQKKNHEIDILAGAYMMVKKSVLEKTGGFDEAFFMYGEDIDLSYRITLAGYKIFYLGESTIIHFKGESTKKGIAYTKIFYKAMDIFVEKHYKKKSPLFTGLMHIAIAVRQGVSFMGNLFSGPAPVKTSGATLLTIIAGDTAETNSAAAALSAQPIQRSITCVESIPEIYAPLQLRGADEIVFCAGAICYKEIIQCTDSLYSNINYKFFAAGSKSIVGSMSAAIEIK